MESTFDREAVARTAAGSGLSAAEVSLLAANAESRLEPTSDLGAVKRAVEAAVREHDTTAGQDAAVREVMGRTSANLFNDDDAEVRRLVSKWAAQLWQNNPREIKRFLNLFRFFMFVKAERFAANRPSPSDDQLAKLAVLSIRWPHLTGVLGRRMALDDEHTVLERIEVALSAGTAIPADVPLPDWVVSELGASNELREYLATEPRLGRVIAGFA